MNILHTKSQISSLALDRSPVDTCPHVVVLLPDDFDDSTLTHKIWEVADLSGAHVQLLSLCQDAAQEPGLRRNLVTMASLLHHGNVTADWDIHRGTDWVELVKKNSHPDDLIICFTEQRTGLLQRPLSQILQSTLKNPVYILSSLTPRILSPANRVHELLAWIGSLTILVAALRLQSQIVSIAKDSVQTILLILSVIAEMALVGGWNSLFG